MITILVIPNPVARIWRTAVRDLLLPPTDTFFAATVKRGGVA